MSRPGTGARVEGFAELDLDRQERRGYPEAVYCAGKTPEQVRAIALAVAERPEQVHLFTRASDEHAAAVREALPDAAWDPDARLLAWPPAVPPSTGGLVLVLAAGTSDLPVAREAWLTARYLGRAAELVVDVGVAGLHRILGKLDLRDRVRLPDAVPAALCAGLGALAVVGSIAVAS